MMAEVIPTSASPYNFLIVNTHIQTTCRNCQIPRMSPRIRKFRVQFVVKKFASVNILCTNTQNSIQFIKINAGKFDGSHIYMYDLNRQFFPQQDLWFKQRRCSGFKLCAVLSQKTWNGNETRVWRCMHRASSYNMYINQQDAQNSCD